MKLADKRKAGAILGRDGISERIKNLAESIVNGSPKNAIEKAGRIHELVNAAKYDEYWHEKAECGMIKERNHFESLNDNYNSKYKSMSEKFN